MMFFGVSQVLQYFSNTSYYSKAQAELLLMLYNKSQHEDK